MPVKLAICPWCQGLVREGETCPCEPPFRSRVECVACTAVLSEGEPHKPGCYRAREEAAEAAHDEINHPAHYMSPGGIEAIEVIEAFGLGYHRGNAIKYILRAGRKVGEGESPEAAAVRDLRKAAWYLDREIRRLVSNPGHDTATEAEKE